MKENPVPKIGTAQFPKWERVAISRSQNWYKLFPKLERKQHFSTTSRSHFWDILTYHVPTERKGHSMTEDNKTTIKACDLIVHRSAELMLEQGASIGMVLDRLLTFSAGQACKIDGAFHAAQAFRQVADQIEGGVFAHIEPAPKGKGH